VTTAVIAIGISACSSSSRPASLLSDSSRAASVPSSDSSAIQVAHRFLAAYQSGDAATLRALTDVRGEVAIRPGDLGTITSVRWGQANRENTRYQDTVRPDVYVSFNAITTGSPDGTIPKQADWAWGFVLARRAPASPWLVVDDGVG
jgi:hypothetical protein